MNRVILVMELVKGIESADMGIYFDNILVISDIHIGYEEALNKQGYLVPRFGFSEIIKRLDKIFSEVKRVDKVVLNGDLKHEFGKISETEWRHTLRLLDYLGRKCKEIILIKGNHDTILGPIAKKRNVRIEDSVKVKDKLIVHGDVIKDVPKGVKTI